jgi:hypothetical protein
MLFEIFLLLVIYQFKHFFADYIFQGKYMLGKFKDKDWFLPLLAHVSCHGIATFIIAVIFVSNFWIVLGVTALDMVAHFIMDRVKASSKMLGRYKIDQKQFWWSLGFDQMFHHLTHYLIIFILVV